MLKALRKKGVAKKIFVVLAIVIVPAFVLWGSASLLRSQRNAYAGKIFGRKVSFDEFQESLNAVRTQALMQFGENFYKLQRFLSLEQEAWDRLILLHEAKKRRTRISDQEVIEEISKLPFFQKNGKFDDKIYQDVLEYGLKTPPRFFEEHMRQQLKLNKLYLEITDKLQISDEDLLAAYKKENEKAKVSYLFIPVANFEKEISLKNNEAQDYFHSHRQEFKQPPAINIQYVGFEYPRDAKEEDKQQLQNKVRDIYAQLQSGEPLEKIVAANNAVIKETGFFSLEDALPSGVPLEIIQVALTLEGRKFSNPALASTGCFIVRIKDKRDSYIPEFPEAKPKVEKLIIQKKARELAQARAKQIHDKINLKVKNLNGWASDLELKTGQTSLFKLGEYLPNVGPSIEFQNVAFGLKDKNIVSEVVPTPRGFYILKLDEFSPIDMEKFKNDKGEFKNRILEEKRKEFFNKFFEDLKKKASLLDNVSRMKLYGQDQ